MERDDKGYKIYTYAWNDVRGRLLELKIPAKHAQEAEQLMKQLLCDKNNIEHMKIGLNDIRDYTTGEPY